MLTSTKLRMLAQRLQCWQGISDLTVKYAGYRFFRKWFMKMPGGFTAHASVGFIFIYIKTPQGVMPLVLKPVLSIALVSNYMAPLQLHLPQQLVFLSVRLLTAEQKLFYDMFWIFWLPVWNLWLTNKNADSHLTILVSCLPKGKQFCETYFHLPCTNLVLHTGHLLDPGLIHPVYQRPSGQAKTVVAALQYLMKQFFWRHLTFQSAQLCSLHGRAVSIFM